MGLAGGRRGLSAQVCNLRVVLRSGHHRMGCAGRPTKGDRQICGAASHGLGRGQGWPHACVPPQHHSFCSTLDWEEAQLSSRADVPCLYEVAEHMNDEDLVPDSWEDAAKTSPPSDAALYLAGAR